MIACDWDTGNSAKCEKHGLTRAQIEIMFRGGLHVAPDPEHSTNAEQRFIALGPTPEGRPAFIAFCWRDGKIRPISARYMHAREVTRYAEAFPNIGSRPDN
ncbi:BrnT family toxin [Roseinatronobacter sp.]